VPYINGKREDWSYICENNRIVAKEDDIVFRYEEAFSIPNLIATASQLTGSLSKVASQLEQTAVV
jgi:hypothetical protein